MKILLVGDILRPSSFANVNLHTWFYLNKLHDVWIYPVQAADEGWDDAYNRYASHLPLQRDELQRKIYKETEQQHFDFILYFSVHYLNPKCTINATANKHIFFTVWSHQNYSTPWAKELNRFDEVWVPSEANKLGIEMTGACTKPIYVIPHGYEPSIFKPQNRNKEATFKFGMCNSICNFKGADLAIKAFIDLFSVNDPVELWIMSTSFLREKDNTSDPHGLYYDELQSIIKSKRKQTKIFYTARNCNLQEMSEFYHNIDCVITPHRGDGFGLIGLEAMACGTPIIVSKYHGPVDYITDNYPYWVHGYMEWTDLKSGRHHFPDGGANNETYYYFEPNFDDLKCNMLEAYTKWKNNATINTKDFLIGKTWEQVAQIIDKRLRGE